MTHTQMPPETVGTLQVIFSEQFDVTEFFAGRSCFVAGNLDFQMSTYLIFFVNTA